MFRVLHYINEVYKEQSFSKAAQKLYLSQPSLSLTVKKYEKEIGIQIFDRSSTPVKLTDAGEVFVREIQQILAIERDLKTYVEDYKESKVGNITLGAPHIFSSYLLPRLIARFLQVYPNINIQLEESDFPTLQEITLGGRVDLLFESQEFDKQVFQIYPLFEEHILLAVPMSDPVNQGMRAYALTTEDILSDHHVAPEWPCIPLHQFAKKQFLILKKGHDMHSRGMRLCREHGFEPKVFMYLNQLMTAYTLADQQLGITFVSDTAIKISNTGQKLIYYKLDGQNAKRHINMVHKRNRYVSKPMWEFINMVNNLSSFGITSICN